MSEIKGLATALDLDFDGDVDGKDQVALERVDSDQVFLIEHDSEGRGAVYAQDKSEALELIQSYLSCEADLGCLVRWTAQGHQFERHNFGPGELGEALGQILERHPTSWDLSLEQRSTMALSFESLLKAWLKSDLSFEQRALDLKSVAMAPYSPELLDALYQVYDEVDYAPDGYNLETGRVDEFLAELRLVQTLYQYNDSIDLFERSYTEGLLTASDVQALGRDLLTGLKLNHIDVATQIGGRSEDFAEYRQIYLKRTVVAYLFKYDLLTTVPAVNDETASMSISGGLIIDSKGAVRIRERGYIADLYDDWRTNLPGGKRQADQWLQEMNQLGSGEDPHPLYTQWLDVWKNLDSNPDDPTQIYNLVNWKSAEDEIEAGVDVLPNLHKLRVRLFYESVHGKNHSEVDARLGTNMGHTSADDDDSTRQYASRMDARVYQLGLYDSFTIHHPDFENFSSLVAKTHEAGRLGDDQKWAYQKYLEQMVLLQFYCMFGRAQTDADRYYAIAYAEDFMTLVYGESELDQRQEALEVIRDYRMGEVYERLGLLNTDADIVTVGLNGEMVKTKVPFVDSDWHTTMVERAAEMRGEALIREIRDLVRKVLDRLDVIGKDIDEIDDVLDVLMSDEDEDVVEKDKKKGLSARDLYVDTAKKTLDKLFVWGFQGLQKLASGQMTDLMSLVNQDLPDLEGVVDLCEKNVEGYWKDITNVQGAIAKVVRIPHDLLEKLEDLKKVKPGELRSADLVSLRALFEDWGLEPHLPPFVEAQLDVLNNILDKLILCATILETLKDLLQEFSELIDTYKKHAKLLYGFFDEAGSDLQRYVALWPKYRQNLVESDYKLAGHYQRIETLMGNLDTSFTEFDANSNLVGPTSGIRLIVDKAEDYTQKLSVESIERRIKRAARWLLVTPAPTLGAVFKPNGFEALGSVDWDFSLARHPGPKQETLAELTLGVVYPFSASLGAFSMVTVQPFDGESFGLSLSGEVGAFARRETETSPINANATQWRSSLGVRAGPFEFYGSIGTDPLGRDTGLFPGLKIKVDPNRLGQKREQVESSEE